MSAAGGGDTLSFLDLADAAPQLHRLILSQILIIDSRRDQTGSSGPIALKTLTTADEAKITKLVKGPSPQGDIFIQRERVAGNAGHDEQDQAVTKDRHRRG